jgi:hypothetical protein
MPYRETMNLPIKAFWMLSRNIDRIKAQEDMRSLTVAACSQGSAEAAQSYRESLVIEIGTITKFKFDPIGDAVRDDDGISVLKGMADQM